MSHTESLLCVGFVAGIMGAYGLIEVILPARLMELLNRWGGTGRWSRRDPRRKLGIWQHRVSGFIILLMAAWIVQSVLEEAQAPGVSRLSAGLQRARTGRPPSLALVVSVALVAGGVYALCKPRAFLKGCERFIPGRVLTENALQGGGPGARIFGALMVLFGVSALLVWLGAL